MRLVPPQLTRVALKLSLLQAACCCRLLDPEVVPQRDHARRPDSSCGASHSLSLAASPASLADGDIVQALHDFKALEVLESTGSAGARDADEETRCSELLFSLAHQCQVRSSLRLCSSSRITLTLGELVRRVSRAAPSAASPSSLTHGTSPSRSPRRHGRGSRHGSRRCARRSRRRGGRWTGSRAQCEGAGASQAVVLGFPSLLALLASGSSSSLSKAASLAKL